MNEKPNCLVDHNGGPCNCGFTLEYKFGPLNAKEKEIDLLVEWASKEVRRNMLERLAMMEKALKKIADREHLEDESTCTCYYGDNGYTCGTRLAEKAIDSLHMIKEGEKK